MMMAYWGWKPYVSAAQRREQANRAVRNAKKAGKIFAPVVLASRPIATTFWGKAWCDNLEAYSDFENRLPRGRSYVRNGAVIDLKIEPGKVIAQVMGSSLYRIEIVIAPVPATKWRKLVKDCTGSIATLVELLQGRFSRTVMSRICAPKTGLFPSPKEIRLGCSCPDWAEMCKHVAAALYGVGARLDEQPKLLFVLRQVDANELLSVQTAEISKAKKAPAKAKVLNDVALADVFGIELATVDAAIGERLPEKKRSKVSAKSIKPAKERVAKSGTKVSARPAKNPAAKPAAKSTARKKAAPKKLAAPTPTNKMSARLRHRARSASAS
jgi:uncharacterized Zn finger protein